MLLPTKTFLASMLSITSLSLASLIANPSNPAVAYPGMRGEVLPTFQKPNLLPMGDFENGMAGWRLETEPGVEVAVEAVAEGGKKALRLRKRGTYGAAWLVSDPVPVPEGTRLEISGLMGAREQKYNSTGRFLFQTASRAELFPALKANSVPGRNGHRGEASMIPVRNGEFRRKVFSNTPPKGHQWGRIVFVLEGDGEVVDLANIIVKEPEPDNRVPREMPREKPLSREETAARLMARPDSTSEVKRVPGKPEWWIDGKKEVPFIQMTDVSKPVNGYVRQFAENGINVHIVPLFNKTMKHWTGKGVYHLNKVDEALWHAAGCDPEGMIIVGLNVLSYPEWKALHPEATAQYPDGSVATSRHDDVGPASYWADEYRREVLDLLKTYVEHIHSQPYGRAVIGYFITGGEDGQFYYQVTKNGVILDGQGPSDQVAFKRWLKARYQNDEEKLRTAWNEPSLTFDTVKPPVKPVPWKRAFLDPKTEQPVVDQMAFLNESLGEFLCNIGEQIKRSAGKPVVVGAYYGRAGSFMVYPHFADGAVMFPRKAIDFVGAQGHYYGYREAGWPGINPWAYTSMQRHGVVPMLELDFRTWFSHYKNMEHDYRVARFWNLEDFNGAVQRDAGRMLSMDGGLWWMEMTGGWYRDDQLMRDLGRVRSIAQELYTAEKPKFKPDTVLVLDEKAFLWTTEQVNCWNGPQMHAINVQQRAFQTAGIAFDMIYLDDLLQQGALDYKVYYFLNPYRASEPLRKLAKELVAAGKTVVWQYAPGVLDGPEAMKELTGFAFRPDGVLPGGVTMVFESKAGEAIGKGLLKGMEGMRAGSGLEIASERFVVTGGYDGVLGRFRDGGEPAAVYRRDKESGGLVITLGHPSALNPTLIGNIAKASKAHQYISSGDYFCHTRGDLIVIHALTSGKKQLHLPKKSAVAELLHGKIKAKKTRKLSIPMEVGETVWLKINP